MISYTKGWSSFGCPSNINTMWVWIEGLRPHQNFMTMASPSVYSAFSMSSSNSSMYSSTERLPWWYWRDSNRFMVWVCSCRGKDWYRKASLNSFQSLNQTLPVFDACVNTHEAKVATLPIFMKDKVHRIHAWLLWNSFAHGPKYRVHELKNVHPFAWWPSYSEGFASLAKWLEAVLVSPKAAPGRSATMPSVTIIRFSNLLSRFCFSCLSLASSCSMAHRHSANSSSNGKDMVIDARGSMGEAVVTIAAVEGRSIWSQASFQPVL